MAVDLHLDHERSEMKHKALILKAKNDVAPLKKLHPQ
jgi:hypothetical protein